MLVLAEGLDQLHPALQNNPMAPAKLSETPTLLALPPKPLFSVPRRAHQETCAVQGQDCCISKMPENFSFHLLKSWYKLGGHCYVPHQGDDAWRGRFILHDILVLSLP